MVALVSSVAYKHAQDISLDKRLITFIQSNFSGPYKSSAPQSSSKSTTEVRSNADAADAASRRRRDDAELAMAN
ncbi:hypothetical protein THAOC_04583 [Thalassiosira oceanica]|uniref:Uncharacterized protein n=1 Tax=Thalassiosira oceanica TaxID=159749 RepID=K0T9L7_THAOC|nr:hypothetical protein THAOC_04583 [Thalassiosira oceanica]|eukprot:EJK73774.1 hypothetical protein THAOC_04583 [Thalassiosira oceanica]